MKFKEGMLLSPIIPGRVSKVTFVVVKVMDRHVKLFHSSYGFRTVPLAVAVHWKIKERYMISPLWKVLNENITL
jgi:hypothetical protein